MDEDPLKSLWEDDLHPGCVVGCFCAIIFGLVAAVAHVFTH